MVTNIKDYSVTLFSVVHDFLLDKLILTDSLVCGIRVCVFKLLQSMCVYICMYEVLMKSDWLIGWQDGLADCRRADSKLLTLSLNQ